MIVGLNGTIGAGKSAAGDRLAYLYQGDAVQISFARLLKESSAALFDVLPAMWETWKNDPHMVIRLVDETTTNADGSDYVLRELTAREFLQRYGTESHRDVFGDDFWVEQAMDPYEAYKREGLAYVTDCRFVNEAMAIKNWGGVIIKLLGPGDDGSETGHVSESHLPDELVNFWVDNTVRDDDFRSLDESLKGIMTMVGLPIQRRGRVLLAGSEW